MSQILEGIDIYDCQFFMIDDGGRLKFAKGRLYERTPESFKSLSEIKDVIRYCIWILEQNDLPSVTKYAAIVYHNRVNERLKSIERDFRKVMRKQQINSERSLKDSISKTGRKYV